MIKLGKSLFKASFYFLSRIILFTAFGILINWVYLSIMCVPIISAWFKDIGPAAGTVPGAFMGLLLNWHIILIFLLFIFGFPILWFIVGKMFGFGRALLYIFNTVKTPLYDMLFKAFYGITDKEQFANLPLKKKVVTILTQIEKINKLPYGLKVILSLLTKMLPFNTILDMLLKHEGDSLEFKTILIQIIDTCIEEKLSSPWWLFFAAAALNILVMIVIGILV